jgi:hypothetical protein
MSSSVASQIGRLSATISSTMITAEGMAEVVPRQEQHKIAQLATTEGSNRASCRGVKRFTVAIQRAAITRPA